jgi:hypothetical protein
MTDEDCSNASASEAQLQELKAFAERLQTITRELEALRHELEVHFQGPSTFVN